MSLLHTFAELLQRAAQAAAPRERAEWSRAMAGEFASLDDSRRALAWSAGCLVAALGWRLRAEAIYLLALAAILVGWPWVIAAEMAMWRLPPGPMIWMEVTHIVPLAAVAFALTLYRPSRALVTATAVTALAEGGLINWVLTRQVAEFAETWVESAWWTGGFLILNCWPSFAGAAAAWLVANRQTRQAG